MMTTNPDCNATTAYSSLTHSNQWDYLFCIATCHKQLKRDPMKLWLTLNKRTRKRHRLHQINHHIMSQWRHSTYMLGWHSPAQNSPPKWPASMGLVSQVTIPHCATFLTSFVASRPRHHDRAMDLALGIIRRRDYPPRWWPGFIARARCGYC